MIAFSYRSNDTRAIGSNQSRLALGLEKVGDADHVVLGNTLRDADNEADLCLDGLFDTGSSEGRGNEDSGGIGAGLLYRIRDGSKDWLSKMRLTGLLRVGATDNVGAILNGLLSMESSLPSGEALENNLGVAIYPQVHVGRGIR